MSDRDDPVRQYSLSGRAMHYLASLGAGFVLAVTALSMIVALNGSARYDVLKLQREKALLSTEVGEIQGRVTQVEGSIEELIGKDETFRLLAGLEPIAEEIFEVGVGGGGMGRPESSPLWEEDPASAAVTFATSYDILALERRARLLSESLTEAMEALSSAWVPPETTMPLPMNRSVTDSPRDLRSGSPKMPEIAPHMAILVAKSVLATSLAISVAGR